MTTTSAAPCPLHPWIAQPCNICTTTFSVAPAQEPPGIAPHVDDVGVDRFAAAMKAKLAEKRAEGYEGWNSVDECPPGRLAQLLHDHLAKGDPLDVGNFAMMLWNRGESCVLPAQEPPAAQDYDALIVQLQAGAVQLGDDVSHRAAIAIAALRAERDALRADAERYRWLRAAQSQTARNWIVINNRNMYGEHELDAAIDAARGRA